MIETMLHPIRKLAAFSQRQALQTLLPGLCDGAHQVIVLNDMSLNNRSDSRHVQGFSAYQGDGLFHFDTPPVTHISSFTGLFQHQAMDFPASHIFKDETAQHWRAFHLVT